MLDDNYTIAAHKNYYSSDGGATWIEHYTFWRQPETVGYNMVRARVEARIAPPTPGTPTATRTPSATPTITPTPLPTPTGNPLAGALWPGEPIGAYKQHTMVRGPNGRRHLVYLGPDRRSLFYAWTDDGQTWLPAPEQRVPFHVFDQPGGGGSLGMDPDGQSLHLIVGQDLSGSPNAGINGALYFRYSAGQWSAPEPIAKGGFGYNLAVGPDGRVHAIWSDSDVWYRVRTTDGVWERARRLVSGGWHPDIDIGPDGQVHVVFNGNGLCCAASWVEVFYIHSGDGGTTWQVPEQLTFDTVWTGAAVGAADARGGYHLAYLIRSAFEGDMYHRYRRPDGSWTQPELVFQAITTGQTGYESPSLEVDAAGNLASLFSCAVPGQSNSVCLRARTWQGRWLDARRLSIFGAAAPSLAGGTFDAAHIDAVWSTQGYLIHRVIGDMAWPATPTPTPTPTTTPAAYHVRVVDDQGIARSGARVYRNGAFAGITRADGVLNFDRLAEGDELIALAPLSLDAAATSGRTARAGHDRDLDTGTTVEPWAFQVFLTNMPQSPFFGPLPPGLLGDGAPGERRIVVRGDSALILLNLTVSIEWDADQAYLDDLELGLRRASAFLYDVTDGQMALGRVAIFERGERWVDADIRIAANNQVYPRAAVAGIDAERSDFDVRLGPLWNGSSARLRGEDGPWSRPAGYRTIVHELGHYVLGLFDEYIYYAPTASGFSVEDAHCTHLETSPPSGNPPPEALRASIMDNQHVSSELADAGQPILWSEACKQTEQWARNGVSDWETVWQRFRAANPPAAPPCGASAALQAAYCLWRPAASSRNAGVPQPSPDPPAQRGWPWPVIERHTSPSGPPLRDLYVQWTGPEQPGRSYRLRAVVRQVVDGRTTYTEQGLTGFDNRITLFGAPEGATVLLNTLDRSWQPSVQVTSSQAITLTLNRPALSSAAASETSPRMVLSPQTDGQGLLVEVVGGPGGELWAEYALAGQVAQRVKLVAAGAEQAVTLAVDLRYRASGAVTIVDSAGRPVGPEFSAAFVGRGLAAPAPADVFSTDGRLWLHLPTASVVENTFVVMSSYGALPGDWPADWAPLGQAYAIRYPAGTPPPTGLAYLRPDPNQLTAMPVDAVALLGQAEGATRWQPLSSEWSPAEGYLAVEWGAGFLGAAWQEAVRKVYVPLVLR
ncbi:MAG: hypothetical protein CVU38_07645 [Chloroflexi bacterium HGW-Chloroflexi-1]|nr:MAG: hypothetical protein CVU38_07645 [Chloroflexi bacterium HGW-Chloroflexi-1]